MNFDDVARAAASRARAIADEIADTEHGLAELRSVGQDRSGGAPRRTRPRVLMLALTAAAGLLAVAVTAVALRSPRSESVITDSPSTVSGVAQPGSGGTAVDTEPSTQETAPTAEIGPPEFFGRQTATQEIRRFTVAGGDLGPWTDSGTSPASVDTNTGASNSPPGVTDVVVTAPDGTYEAVATAPGMEAVTWSIRDRAQPQTDIAVVSACDVGGPLVSEPAFVDAHVVVVARTCAREADRRELVVETVDLSSGTLLLSVALDPDWIADEWIEISAVRRGDEIWIITNQSAPEESTTATLLATDGQRFTVSRPGYMEFAFDPHELSTGSSVPATPVSPTITSVAAPTDTAAATASPSTGEECMSDVVAPPTLVDGSDPGEPVAEETDGYRTVTWGSGQQAYVTQDLDPGPYEGETAADADYYIEGVRGRRNLVTSDTHEAAVIPVGDPPLGFVTIYLAEIGTDCIRIYRIGPGYTVDEAIAFTQGLVDSMASTDRVAPATTEPVPATTRVSPTITSVAALTDTAATTASPSTGEECMSDVVAPPTLVDGSDPGEPVAEESDGYRTVTWGAGQQAYVTQDLDPVFYEGATAADAVEGVRGWRNLVTSDTHEAAVIPVGDPPISAITIYLVELGTECIRIYRIGPGYTVDEAIAFAQSWVDSFG